MSGDPPSEPPEDGEGDGRGKRAESPDPPADEPADSDQPEPAAAESEPPADEDAPDSDPDEDVEEVGDVNEGTDDGAVGQGTDKEADEGESADGNGAEENADGGAEGEGDAKDGDSMDGAAIDEAEDVDEPAEYGDRQDKAEEEAEASDGEPEGVDDGREGEDEVEEEEDEASDSDTEGEDDGPEDEDEVEENGSSADTSVEMHDDTTPIERKTGPATDTEQPLADHIEEMIKRLAVVVIIAGAVSLLAFPFGEDFITFLWYSVLPADISQPHVYHPLELVMTQLKAASLLGLVLALPVFVYETYAFMRPGLYPHERRYYLAAVPTSLVLAFVGLLFGYFLVLPAVMTYFLYYSRDVVDIAFALGQTFDLMLILLGYLAIVFQIPLFIMLAIMMGLTTRTWLEDRRLIFWGAFLGISFLFSPDPTGMAPILVAATMVGLFEGTLLLLRWTGR